MLVWFFTRIIINRLKTQTKPTDLFGIFNDFLHSHLSFNLIILNEFTQNRYGFVYFRRRIENLNFTRRAPQQIFTVLGFRIVYNINKVEEFRNGEG